jgi:hypothetical protein
MALPNTEILVGAPPLLWSNVHEAFEKINQNFTALDLATGGSAVNLETLSTDVSPAVTNDFALGNDASRWKSVFVGEWNDSVQGEGNGVWLGAAQIRGITGYIDLPAGSRVGGDLIIDSDKTFFKEIQVDNNLSVVATQFSDSFNLLSGTGIAMSVSSGSDSIEINNTGILSVSASLGISVSTASGTATVTNTGVRSLTSTTALPAGRTTGAGINISGATGDAIRVTNTGIISVSSGVGITVSLDSSSGDVTITNSAPAVNAFTQIEVDGDSANRLLADAVSDVLNIRSGQGIALTKTPGTDTLTITVDPRFDLKGSIFGDDSTKIVDAVENKVFAEFFGNLTGNVIGNANSATVSATLDITDTNGLTTVYYPTFVENRTTGQTVRADVDLSYRTDTNTLTAPAFSGNLTGAVTGNIFTSLIDSADSSAITVTPTTIFSSDVTVENDLSVTGRVTIGGDLIINGTTTTINAVTLTVDDKNIELGSIVSPTDVTADGGGITLKGTTDKTFTYVNSTGLWTANIGVAATSFTGLAAAATTASTAASVGYMGIPQSATTTTLVIGDAGKHIYVNTSGQTLTIPAATSVAYPIGTTITFIAGPSATTVTIAITTDTMYLTGTGTTGSRTLAAHGIATAVKVSGTSSSGVWFINGSGLT